MMAVLEIPLVREINASGNSARRDEGVRNLSRDLDGFSYLRFQTEMIPELEVGFGWF